MKKQLGKIDVSHLAKLANLSLTKEEIKKYSQQLTKILNYVSQLKEIDTSMVKPTSRTINLINVSFSDGLKEKQTLSSLKNLKSKNVGGKKYFVVKKIL